MLRIFIEAKTSLMTIPTPEGATHRARGTPVGFLRINDPPTQGSGPKSSCFALLQDHFLIWPDQIGGGDGS